MKTRRNRLHYAMLTAIVIVAGWASCACYVAGCGAGALMEAAVDKTTPADTRKQDNGNKNSESPKSIRGEL